MKKYNIWDSTTDKAQRIKFIYILCYGHLFIKYEPKELKKKVGDLWIPATKLLDNSPSLDSLSL